MTQPQLPKIPKLNEKICFFATGNEAAFSDAVNFWRSMTKFHDPKEITMKFYTNVVDPEKLKLLPKGIEIADLTPYLEDPAFFYRQKPVLGEELLKEYDLVVGFDVDQVVLAPLDDVIKVKTYDVGCVVNWNRFDIKFYPQVHQMPFVQPIEYYNCGMVAMRGKKFVHDWKVWCFSPMFDRCQFKEQDGLNILTHHGNYSVWCFDIPASKDADIHWYGIMGKGEWDRSQLEGDKIIIPKGLGLTPFPPQKVYLHLAHMGGGHGAPKNNWDAFFPPDVMEYIREKILK